MDSPDLNVPSSIPKHPVRDLEDPLIVSDHDEALCFADLDHATHEFHHPPARSRVEVGVWLVGEDDVGLVRQRATNGETLPLTGAGLSRVTAGQRLNAEQFEQVGGAFVRLPARNAGLHMERNAADSLNCRLSHPAKPS
jgi:hypothetical protein